MGGWQFGPVDEAAVFDASARARVEAATVHFLPQEVTVSRKPKRSKDEEQPTTDGVARDMTLAELTRARFHAQNAGEGIDQASGAIILGGGDDLDEGIEMADVSLGLAASRLAAGKNLAEDVDADEADDDIDDE